MNKDTIKNTVTGREQAQAEAKVLAEQIDALF